MDQLKPIPEFNTLTVHLAVKFTGANEYFATCLVNLLFNLEQWQFLYVQIAMIN